MRVIDRRCAMLLATAGLVSRRGLAENATPLVCGILDSPPWVIHGASLPGIAIDIVSALSQGAEERIEVEVAPHARLVHSMKEGAIDLLMFVPLPELDAFAQDLGALCRLELGLVPRAGLTATRLEDFAGLRIGLIRGGGNSTVTDQLPPYQRVEIVNIAQGLVMIAHDRLDAVVGSRLAVDWHLSQTNMDAQAFGPFLTVHSDPVRLYASRVKPMPADKVDRLRNAVPLVAPRFTDLCAPYVRRV